MKCRATNSRDLLVNFGKCSGSSDKVFRKWSEDFGEVLANISGEFLECFGECARSFGELSREVMAVFGEGLGSFDELPERFLVAFGEWFRSFVELSVNNWCKVGVKKLEKRLKGVF